MAEETTEPTIEQLMAQQTELGRQIAARSIPEVEAAIALLDADAVKALADDVSAIHARLGEGLAQQNLGNILQVLSQVPANLRVALADLQRKASA